MAELLVKVFLHFYGEDKFKVSKKCKKDKRGQQPAILTKTSWSIKVLLYGQKRTFSCRTNAGNPKWVYLAHSGSHSYNRICLILPGFFEKTVQCTTSTLFLKSLFLPFVFLLHLGILPPTIL